MKNIRLILSDYLRSWVLWLHRKAITRSRLVHVERVMRMRKRLSSFFNVIDVLTPLTLFIGLVDINCVANTLRSCVASLIRLFKWEHGQLIKEVQNCYGNGSKKSVPRIFLSLVPV